MQDFSYKITAAGRVNIIGEHIDYCGGKVFPAALSLCNTVYVRPNGTNKINLSWTTLPDKVSLDIDKLSEYKNLKYGNYQAGAAYVWQKAGHKVVGCDMLQDCTVPFGSGLSSSAAIEVSTLVALAVLAGEAIDKKEISLLAQQDEREYCGTNCGIMDQYASANGKKGYAMLLDCNAVEHEFIPLELGEYALVIANCKKPHNLVESKYNERRSEAEQALAIVQKVLPVACLAQVKVADMAQFQGKMPANVYARFSHIVQECDRVQKAVGCMQAGDIVGLGQLLDRSHESLRDLYEVTGKELDTLQAIAVAQPGCVGSRMTGGGFGGCTISLVKKECVPAFCQALHEQYTAIIGHDCDIYDATIADGITVESLK